MVSSGYQQQADALISLVRASLRRGHWKVALRRLLMLEARGHAIPDDLQTTTQALMARCAQKELEKMQADAWVWGLMVRRRYGYVPPMIARAGVRDEQGTPQREHRLLMSKGPQ